MQQEFSFTPSELTEEVKILRTKIDLDREQAQVKRLDSLFESASLTLQVCLKTAREKGASSWVTACPSYDHHTVLSKGDFVDAVT